MTLSISYFHIMCIFHAFGSSRSTGIRQVIVQASNTMRCGNPTVSRNRGGSRTSDRKERFAGVRGACPGGPGFSFLLCFKLWNVASNFALLSLLLVAGLIRREALTFVFLCGSICLNFLQSHELDLHLGSPVNNHNNNNKENKGNDTRSAKNCVGHSF